MVIFMSRWPLMLIALHALNSHFIILWQDEEKSHAEYTAIIGFMMDEQSKQSV